MDDFRWDELVREVIAPDLEDPYLELADGELASDRSLLRIHVTSNWARRAIEARHLDRLRERLRTWYPDDDCEVEIVVVSPTSSPGDAEDLYDLPPPQAHGGTAAAEQARPVRHPGIIASATDAASGLNADFRFDKFVVGSSNRLAYAASLRVAEQPGGREVNPLFIYGGVGLGKTHLLQAIGNLTRDKYPHLKVLYVSAETFTNDMVEAIRRQETRQIRDKYRTMDVLLIDDIHFLQRKEQTQTEFFYTFNDLHNANKQIVLASDSLPDDMSELTERVRSRFKAGVVMSIDPPELETRTAILLRKADELGIDRFPEDAAGFIAERVTTNIRELEGMLATVYQVATESGRPLDLALVRETLGSPTGAHRVEPIRSGAIQRIVSEYYQIRATELKSKRRTKRLSGVRHIAMYLCRELTDLPLVEIGRDFGGRDHSTVISACDKIRRGIDQDPDLAQTVELLVRRVREDNGSA